MGIHPFFQLVATFEKGQLLGFDLDRFACLRVVPGISIIVFDLESPKAPDLHPVIICKGIRHAVKSVLTTSLAFLIVSPVSLLKASIKCVLSMTSPLDSQ